MTEEVFRKLAIREIEARSGKKINRLTKTTKISGYTIGTYRYKCLSLSSYLNYEIYNYYFDDNRLMVYNDHYDICLYDPKDDAKRKCTII